LATDKDINRPDLNAFNGTRKLVRPKLSLTLGDRRRESSFAEEPLTHARHTDEHLSGTRESSHAEAFYFQKQMQQHTEMTVVLDDGEELSGTIEWFDKCVIKMRAGRRRVMIYKAGIRYLYKTSEANAAGSIMK
jgi:host factor-I protein